MSAPEPDPNDSPPRASATDDARVGENVKALRGATSQGAVAEFMRSEGWPKWSQSTVWSVERGDRPLRLTEAVALARFLEVELGALYRRDAALLSASRDLDRRLNRAAEEFGQVLLAQGRLAHEIAQHRSRGGDVADELDDWAALSDQDLAERMILRLTTAPDDEEARTDG